MKAITGQYQSGELPTILVFDDDDEVRACWKILAEQLELSNVRLFRSWEEFLAGGDLCLIRGAVAFVDNNFEKAGSSTKGVQIALNLRQLGVGKIYSISSDPSQIYPSASLFDLILGTKFPADVRTLL